MARSNPASLEPLSHFKAIGFGVATLLVGVIVTALVAENIKEDSSKEADIGFVESIDQSEVLLERAIEEYFVELRALGAAAVAYEPSSSTEFVDLVESSTILDRLDSVEGLLILRPVPIGELDAFEAEWQEVDPDFAVQVISEDTDLDHHFVVTNYVPGNSIDLQIPVGTDVAPIISVSEALTTASETGRGAAGSFQNDPLLLDIAQSNAFPAIAEILDMDFFMGLPIYSGSDPNGRTPTGQPVIWVAAPMYRFSEVLANITRGQAEHVGVQLSVDFTETRSLLNDELELVAQRDGTAGTIDEATVSEIREFEVSGLSFTATFWGQPDRLSSAYSLVVAAGLVSSLSAALMVYLRWLSALRRRAYAADLADKEHFRRDIIDSVSDPMVVLDSSGVVVTTNPAWRELRRQPENSDPDIGKTYEEALGKIAAGRSDDVGSQLATVLSGKVGAETDSALETGLERKWYSIRMTPLSGTQGGAVVIHTDITERKRSEAELELKATRDPLTGLLNRLAIEEEVDRAMARARAKHQQVGLLFIDLDGFKFVNDNWSHAVGDDVLRDVARRITSAVRTSDVVARLGGDEFLVLIDPLADKEVAERTARRVLGELDAPFMAGPDQLPVGASVGIAVVDDPLAGSGADLIDMADSAMYEAKQSGGGVYRHAK